MIGKSLGHYEVLDAIGSGGMGQVYRARDKKLGREVAVKLLPTAFRSDEKALARFEREAKALAAVNHPNIVTIYSIERDGEDVFLTMELVEGRSLETCVGDEGMTVEEFQKIALPLTDALATAHTNGIIHRDLKPSNIIISDTGVVKVLDFGVALVMNEEQLTDTNIAVGTVAYMSPEQISGGDVDERSDIFSLGIVFYELLSGTRPFRGEHPAATMYSIVNEDAPRLDSVPDTATDVIARCLEKFPEERFANADELNHAVRDLTSITTQTTNDVQPVTPSPDVRDAIDQGDWERAYRTLHKTIEQRDLTPEELEMLATSAFWLSEIDESIQALEKAHAAYAKSRQNISAARVALDLVGWHLEMNAATVAGGWQKRAERLLQDEPESIVHGYLLRRQTIVELGNCNYERALELNHQCGEIAERCDDRDLQTVALHDRGQVLVARGDVEAGIALIDEAMTAATIGEVTLITMGNLYCRTMTVCESIADYNRAREWSTAAWRWSKSYASSSYQGICQIHSATAMRHQGRWEEAEQAVRKACQEFKKNGPVSHAGDAFYELGELALRKGNYQEAEDAFRLAHEYGHDPVPGLSLLRLAQGKSDVALMTIERALNEVRDNRVRRAKILAAATVIALANNKISLAEAAVDELTDISKEFGCLPFKAHALMGLGAVELERGNNDAATLALREAWAVFNEGGFPYEAARARVLMAKAYQRTGNLEDTTMQLEAACKTFAELGAQPDLEIASKLIEESK